MPKETAELPVSPQVRQPADQIQSPSFFDKLKIHKFKILGGVLGVLVFAGAVFGVYKFGQRSIYPEPVEGPTPTPVVVAPTGFSFRCIPKFQVETGPELTASEVYSQACYQKDNKADCEKVDIYRESDQGFGNPDGIPDCKWIGLTQEEVKTGERVYCKDPRPEVCTMECIVNPPYICGSDGKSYCSECQACSNPSVEWYVIQDEPCGTE